MKWAPWCRMEPRVPPDPTGQAYLPTSRPGHRLPHAWLVKGEIRRSTLDLATPGRFALLLGAEGLASAEAADKLLGERRLPLDVFSIGGRDGWIDADRNWRSLREVGEGGAILVRPDSHVAWRAFAPSSDPRAALLAAVDAVLGSQPSG